MSGYAPDAIQRLYDRIKTGYPAAINAGIYGNKPGYHNCRNQNHAGDYSVQRPDDKRGDGWAGAALDVTLYNPADMIRLTGRLVELTFARDPRIQCVREFFGTTDGRNVTGLDVRDVRWVTSDASHLWHEHISFYRAYATDTAALNGLADAILGGVAGAAPTPPAAEKEKEDDDDMKPYFIRADGNAQLYMIIGEKIIKQSDDEGRLAAAVYGIPFTITRRVSEPTIVNVGNQLNRPNTQR